MNQARDYGEALNAAMIEVIEQARWEQKVRSIRALAEKAGMTHTYLNARLNGATPFSMRDLGALSYALDIPLNALLARVAAGVSTASGTTSDYVLAADDTAGKIEEQEADDTP